MNPGQSPTGSTVILSNVQSASIVYTFDAVYPMLWDNLFTSALVAYMASEVTLGLWSKNPKYGMGIRREQIAIAQKKLIEARIADGNASTVSTSHLPDWMRARASYGNNGFNNNGWGLDGGAGGAYGVWGNGYSGSLSFSDGSAY